MAKKYDPNKDYSKAIEEAKAKGQDTTQLEKERQAKIDDKYGGKEPTMYGSNKTYSQASKDNDNDTISNAVSIANSKNKATQNSQNTGMIGTDLYGGLNPYTDAIYHERAGAAVNNPGLEITKSKALAGQSVKIGNYTVTFNNSGYVTKRVKDNGASATHTIRTTHANDSVNHQLAYQAAAAGNWDLAYKYINQIPGVMNEHGEDRSEAKQYAYELQNEFGYNANNYYGGLYDSVYGAGAWDGGTNTGQPIYNEYSHALVDAYNQGLSAPSAGLGESALILESLLNSGNMPDLSGDIYGGSFDYGDFGGVSGAPEWNGSEWDSVLESLAQQLLGMSYDQWTQGDQYASLANRYGQQGRLSMQDVLGQVSSRTGGLASSWAQTAAQQQYNSFMSDLERAAMEMYGVEQGDLLDKANLARQYAMDDYNEYVDRWNQWADNRDFAYDAYRDSVADQQYADALDLEQAKDQAELLAAAGDFSGYGALGYTPDQIGLLQAAYGAQNATPGTIDSSKKTGGGGGFDNGSLSTAQVKQLQQALGVTADGLWGKNSKAAAGGLSAEEAWAALGGGSLGGGGNDYWTGDGSTSGGKTSLNWDQDEGIFTWNGRNYYSIAELADAIDAANLTDAEKQALTRKFGTFGFDIEIT